MPDEATTPPPDTQAPPSDSTSSPQGEPVTTPVAEPTPPPQENTTPPQSSPQLRGGGEDDAGGEETPAPVPEPEPLSQSETGTGEHVQANPPAPLPPPRLEDSAPLLGQEGRNPPPLVKEELRTTTPPVPSLEKEGRVRGDIANARAALQDRKRKRLDKIMAKLAEKGKITNDEVEKLLHISDATATRYLQTLEKENRIKQTGVTGTAVFYEKI